MSYGSEWVQYIQSKIIWWICDAHDIEYNYNEDDEDDDLKKKIRNAIANVCLCRINEVSH